MKVRNLLCVAIILSMVLAVAGCETVPKKFKEEVKGIKSRVDTLESKVDTMETKQADVERMTSEQTQAIDDLKSMKQSVSHSNISVKAKSSPKTKEGIKEIQLCLKNAGFYDGKIDGVRGRGTKSAIKEFQKANGLRVDGKVGPKTWQLLSKYASGPAANTAGEEAK